MYDKMDATCLQIKKFDATIISQKRRSESAPIICVIGKRNTGKSEVIRNLLYHNRTIPTGIVISPTESGNSFYSKFCPDLFIHHEFNPDLLRIILKRQKRKVKLYGKNPKNDFFLILDDCMYNSKEICNNIHIKEIFRNGRHFQIMLIMSAQYVMDLPVSLRSNIDYVFCMRENNIQNAERLYKSFFGIFSNKNMFIQAFNVITENYGSIVLDNLSRSNRICECVYWFRAPFPPPVFRLGSAKMWKTHQQKYDESRLLEDDHDTKLQSSSVLTVAPTPSCELIL